MSEKQHKTKKFANYHNVMVINTTALGRHVFVSSQIRLSMVFDVIKMISTQIHPC